LRKEGIVTYHPDFTKVVVRRSSVAFSFFKQIFVGNDIPKEKETQILAHELVHVKQWHSLDLLFFELMRVVFWFNPFVYLYQSRIAELHEFIADAVVAKTYRKEQYQALLSETFQTKNFSFINQFFKESLIKKRIVMLTKEKSKQFKLLKYLGILPLLLTMVAYTSCESEGKKEEEPEATNININTEKELVAFMLVEEAPLFPGCEDSEDSRNCFLEKIQRHIRKNFNYPKEAQDLGIEGRVAVMFTIDENGEITNIEKRGPHQLLEDEVERIIKRLPKMVPGRHNGEVVKVPFSVPVNFVLQNE
jgi:TonB family protein